MTGRVDDYGHPLILVRVFHPTSGQFLDVEAWIDTGFTSGLSLTPAQVNALNFPAGLSVQGSVAGGAQVLFPTATCEVEWFGTRQPLDALVDANIFAMVGLRLLEDYSLTIDYPARTVVIHPSTTP